MRVLLVETTPGAADDVRGRLEEAGHAVLTCPGGTDCSLVGLARCPLVDDSVDVVVDVRTGTEAFSPAEQPLVCGLLAGIPTVVCGPLPVPPSVPTSSVPTSSVPTSSVPTSSVPTSSVPTSSVPTSPVPTSSVPAASLPAQVGPSQAADAIEPVATPSEPSDIWHRADVLCQPDEVLDAIDEATLPTSPTVRHRIATAVRAVLRRRGLTAPFQVAVTTRHGAVDVRLVFTDRVPPPAVREQLRIVVRAVLIPATKAWASATVLIHETSPPLSSAQDEPMAVS